MAEIGSPEGPVLPQEVVKPAEVEKSIVNKALTETAKGLFPIAEWVRSGLLKEPQRVNVAEGAKRLMTYSTAFGGLVDIGRYAVAAGSVINAIDADSTMSIVKFSALAAEFLSPNLVHLASKSRLIRETGRKVGRGAVNAVLGKASAFKDGAPKE